jgi:5-methylcytosine-specific restriction endonuclease McrA
MPYVLKRVMERNLEKYGVVTCEICKQPIESGLVQIDHIMPVSKFSRKRSPFRMNGIHNLQISCERCNRLKSNHTTRRKFRTL